MDNFFDYTATVVPAQTDKAGRLRLSALLCLQQEAGNAQLDGLGITVPFLLAHERTFVLTRTAAVIGRLPAAGETATVRTWAREIKGVQFFRCFTTTDEKGKVLAESVSVYALIDTESRRVLRPRELDPLGSIPSRALSNGCPDPLRAADVETPVLAGTYTVPTDRIDWNGHLNNVYYADILQEHLPAVYKNASIGGFSLRYVREVREGETLTLRCGEGDGCACVRGFRGEELCFEGTVRQ